MTATKVYFFFLGVMLYEGVKWLWRNRDSKKSRRQQFLEAYRILRDEAERHKKAGHKVEFHAVSEAYITLVCVNCPDLQP